MRVRTAPYDKTHIIAKGHGSADEDVRIEFHVDVEQKTPGFELVVDRLMRLRESAIIQADRDVQSQLACSDSR